MSSESRDFFKFWEITETVKDRYIWLQWKTEMKSYVAYRMTAIPMTLSDLEGHVYCLKPF